jgi:hypothetical protein
MFSLSMCTDTLSNSSDCNELVRFLSQLTLSKSMNSGFPDYRRSITAQLTLIFAIIIREYFLYSFVATFPEYCF